MVFSKNCVGRISFFVYNLDSYSGSALQALKLARELKDYSILIFNTNYGKKPKMYRIDEHIVAIDLPKNVPWRIWLIIQYIMQYRMKLIHLHGIYLIGLLIGIVLHRKIVLKTSLMGVDDFSTLIGRKHGRFIHWCLMRISASVVLSEEAKEINSRIIDPNKVYKIPNGVAVRNLSINEKKSHFCIVGLISPRKRTYEAIEYFIQNYSADEQSKLYILGPFSKTENIPEIDSGYVKECFSLVPAGLSKRVFFTGLISQKEVHKIFKRSKVLLHFSKREGMPNVVLEAMSYNCVPIIANGSGVFSELIKDSTNGFIVKDLRPVSMADIEEVIRTSSPSNTIRARFDIERISKIYNEKIYKPLLSNKI